ncbi:hypothetical protein NE857_34080 (plasmid) [Nocardiopsis exhalans]|uniref:Uncharacterized protein n=1 Tax=Nocardiopsis exhalans TaxID=163604 RepID=A0ABY5DJT4_9ACTN|nr:hypothetical protein [Nocardiopsis exhalans]USY23563.1 hypothetical protein NE857_34080 [Nocardiopsis exhalans]
MNSSAANLHQTLTAALTRHGLAPRSIDLTRTPCIQVKACDGSAVVVSNPYGGQLDIALTEYQGVAAYRYPLRYDPAHPPSDFNADPDHLTQVYETPTPCEGLVHQARADIDRLARILAAEVTRPLPDAEISDLLLHALAKEGLPGAVESRGGCADGIVVDLADGTHVMIADSQDSQITYPVTAKAGLLVKRYANHDPSQERVVYESRSDDNIQEVQAAVHAIREESRLPLTETVTAAPVTGATGLVRQFEELEHERVGAVLLKVLRDKGFDCSLRALGSGGEGVSINLGDGTRLVITDSTGNGLGRTVRGHSGLSVVRVCDRTLRQCDVYNSDDHPLGEQDETFSAVVDILAAVAVINTQADRPARF